MRVVTEKTGRAFLQGNTKVCGNTQTDGKSLWLHGNRIAQKTDILGVVMLSLAGWNTPTTRDRLNGLLDLMDIPARYYQHKFEPYLFILERKSRAHRTYEVRHRTEIEADDWFIFVKDDPTLKYVYTEWFRNPEEGHTTALVDESHYQTKSQRTEQ